jgi:hypothetical protein
MHQCSRRAANARHQSDSKAGSDRERITVAARNVEEWGLRHAERLAPAPRAKWQPRDQNPFTETGARAIVAPPRARRQGPRKRRDTSRHSGPPAPVHQQEAARAGV